MPNSPERDAQTISNDSTDPFAEQNPHLCWKCRGLLNTPDHGGFVTKEFQTGLKKGQFREVRHRHHLEDTASSGCLLCYHLLHSLSNAERAVLRYLVDEDTGGESFPDIEYKDSILLELGSAPSISLHVRSKRPFTEAEPGDEIKTLLQLFPAAKTSPFANHGEIRGNTRSDTSKSFMKGWLDRCVETHATCAHQSDKAHYLPSRVINFSLDVPKTLGSPERYAGLSVRDDEPLLGHPYTLAVIVQQYCRPARGGTPSQLSRSFQDAIQVARWLGLRYLWIDSLCIVQDSTADWEKESASMGDVYSNSHCNIAAAHAADGTEGCFIERDPQLVKPLEVDLHWGPAPGRYYVIQWLYWRQKVTETPLNERAWVCQERYLASRTLIFGETQLYWECPECAASETFPLGLPPGVRVALKTLNPQVDGAALRQGRGLSVDPELNAFSLWDRMVYDYSNGKLSYSEDKLVAISGLASRIQEHTQSEYLAGLWRKHLSYQLLWTVSGIQGVISKECPKGYIAPSWSWASMQGTIEDACMVRHSDSHEIILEVLDANIDLVSDASPFGRVKGGHIRARGFLAREEVLLREDPTNQGAFDLVVSGEFAGGASVDDYRREAEPVVHYGFYYLPVRYSTKQETVTQNGECMAVPSLED